jgi:hypothetical protein
MKRRAAKKLPSCDICGIGVGENYIEQDTVRIGRVESCSFCRYLLRTYGIVMVENVQEIDDRRVVKVVFYNGVRTKIMEDDYFKFRLEWDSKVRQI